MRIPPLAFWVTLVASLSAGSDSPGFKFAGGRAGTVSFDPQDYLASGSTVGLQGGMVFDDHRYGLSFEGLVSKPKSKQDPGLTFDHHEFSVTFMTGLASDAVSRFWPYCGLGLGSMTVPKEAPITAATATGSAATAHLSFGLLHRPFGHFIWGVDGRWVVAMNSKNRESYEGALLAGFTWGGPKNSVQIPAPEPAVSAAAAPPPPVPLPVVVIPAAPVPAPPPSVPAPLAAPVASPAPPMAIPTATAAPVVVPAAAALPAAAKSVVADPRRVERLDALRQGDMAKSLELGRERLNATPGGHWTIRLEIADLPATLQNAVAAFPGREPDLFIAPISFKGGKTSYQLFLATYATKAEAERAARAVPAFFLEGGQRPKPYLVSSIPSQGNR